MEKWECVLKKFLDENNEVLKDVEWIIMGSMATALQGANIIPNDLDILMKNKEGVYSLSKLLNKYALEELNKDVLPYSDKWCSTKKTPVLEDEEDNTKDCWTFGRWIIDGFKIECACIDAAQSYLSQKTIKDGVWEGGPETWKFIKVIEWNHYQIPVIPLEIQLETNIKRNKSDRIKKIVELLKKSSFDKDLLSYSLSNKSKERIKKLNII